MNLHRLFGKITKSTKLDDGTLQVEGIASSEAKDAQGEVVKASAIAAALPEYMKFPALREMHQPLAAGKTIAADVAEDGCTYITAKVVDPVAIKKVEEGVYAGFSIGGSVPPGGRSKDNPKVIEHIQLVEISLVDRPANPEAVFTLVKFEEAAKPEAGGAAPASGDASGGDAKAAGSTPAPAPGAAAKTEAPKPGETTVAKKKAKKGMFTVGWAADLCQQLASLAADAQWEADFEGDESKIPGRLKAVCVELCDVLKDLVEEEAGELTAAKGTEAIPLLAMPGTLKKSEKVAVLARAFLVGAGKKPPELPELVELRKRVEEAESATKQAGEALKKVTADRNDLHKKHADATLALKAKGVAKDPRFVEAVAKVEALESALAETQDACGKARDALKDTLGKCDELKKQRDQFEAALAVKTEQAKEQLEGVIEERDALSGQLAEKVTALAKAEVTLKTKGVLKAVPVAKADDVDQVEKESNKPPAGTPERALYEMKKVQAKGGRPLTLGGLPPASQEHPR